MAGLTPLALNCWVCPTVIVGVSGVTTSDPAALTPPTGHPKTITPRSSNLRHVFTSFPPHE